MLDTFVNAFRNVSSEVVYNNVKSDFGDDFDCWFWSLVSRISNKQNLAFNRYSSGACICILIVLALVLKQDFCSALLEISGSISIALRYFDGYGWWLGLLLLLGLVVYVSVFTAEIGSKLRPSSSLQPPLFTYTYGYSFQMVVTGFLAAEVAGTSAVFLFIYWHRNRIAKKEMHRKMTMALVQTPIEISQAGHLLPPFPVNQLEQHHQNQGGCSEVLFRDFSLCGIFFKFL